MHSEIATTFGIQQSCFNLYIFLHNNIKKTYTQKLRLNKINNFYCSIQGLFPLFLYVNDNEEMSTSIVYCYTLIPGKTTTLIPGKMTTLIPGKQCMLPWYLHHLCKCKHIFFKYMIFLVLLWQFWKHDLQKEGLWGLQRFTNHTKNNSASWFVVKGKISCYLKCILYLNKKLSFTKSLVCKWTPEPSFLHIKWISIPHKR